MIKNQNSVVQIKYAHYIEIYRVHAFKWAYPVFFKYEHGNMQTLKGLDGGK